MPVKAKVTEEQAAVIEETQTQHFTAVASSPCGHVNRHHRGLNGQLQPLKCVLPAGHEGDHEADYECLRAADGSFEQAKLEKFEFGGREYVKTFERAFWSDGAAIPAAEIQPDAEQLRALRLKRDAGTK